MKKFVLFVLVLSLVIPTLLIFPGTARACGEREPVTLLALVRKSSTIHIATFRGQEEGEIQKEEGDGDAKYREIKRNFDVSSTLKGEMAKFVTIPERQYIYDEEPLHTEPVEHATGEEPKSEEPQAEKTEEHAASEPEQVNEVEEYDEDGIKPLNPGDNVILFLSTDEESKEITPTDWVDGIKNLSPAEIDVYAARIKEIKPILAAKKPNAEKIIDWLVRLTEDPVTRWDGAYELEQSFFAIEQKNAMEAERKQTPREKDEPEDEIPYSSDTLETSLSTVFAGKLSDHHKQTLTNVLMQSRYRNSPTKKGSDAFVNGDRELMQLVARWADDRVAASFIEQVRAGGFTPYDSSSLMRHIATILGDKQLGTMVDSFDEISYQEDDEEFVAPKPEVKEKETEKAVETESETVIKTESVEKEVKSVETDSELVVEKAAAKPDSKSKAKKPVITYKKVRDDLTVKFLKRAEAVIAENQVRAAK